MTADKLYAADMLYTVKETWWAGQVKRPIRFLYKRALQRTLKRVLLLQDGHEVLGGKPGYLLRF
ncbi:hypothetical protein CDQ84_09885 [Clostridium thermosuccinogenes]|uniref:Uncharacterized protein n=1 Tax=Clostridium thermosuccinogenes TaxID=84032 RepID=A0A2K2FDX5_9CLOT|nr:hypothetical protein [Pseudoclostridium thermosuccinogenes]AUS96866.1 hypothetical protein CDO33_10695 [Pseudoclostridium thermosuccinogenes]PNT92467.1 hypothetical protein CDQ83_02545 [Pseudoclostridium thermosuccinogenes]PNT96983.1 hypothetical protein CDQ85_09735 [Pseudoclostridium thermosuccinogenes]PNT98842.1 hypothetical protein CDQ84_09885 [Pseudoclostridium thermosuccinogenes]